MKKLIFLMTVALCAIFGNVRAVPKVSVTVTVEIARPKHSCTKGIWFCNPTINPSVTLARTVKADFTDNGDGTMTIDFLSSLPDQAIEFFADSDESVLLPEDICRKFGYERIVLIPGRYSVQTSTRTRFGSVTVNIQTK